MRTFWAVMVGVVVCLVLGGGSGLVRRPDDWFARLRRPAWTPPGRVFGVVWPVLYGLMGTAAGLAWSRRPATAWPFAAQLVLNLAWTPIFFRFHRIGIALVEVVALWAAVVATTAVFFRVRPAAGWLMVPYAAWVTFAVGLNAAFWRMNATRP